MKISKIILACLAAAAALPLAAQTAQTAQPAQSAQTMQNAQTQPAQNAQCAQAAQNTQCAQNAQCQQSAQCAQPAPDAQTEVVEDTYVWAVWAKCCCPNCKKALEKQPPRKSKKAWNAPCPAPKCPKFCPCCGCKLDAQCGECPAKAPAPCAAPCSSPDGGGKTPPCKKSDASANGKEACQKRASSACGARGYMDGNFGLDYVSNGVWNAKEKLYNETGVSLSFDYYADIFSNPSGGAAQGTNYTHIMIFGADIDFEKILGVKGASMRISGAYNSGSDLSGKIGNFFTISQSSVTDGWMFYEMYCSQKIELSWGDTLTAKAGRLSMSDTFASLPVFGYLAGGAVDATPESIFFASPYTSETLASWGAVASYGTVQNMEFSLGLFQAPQNINASDWHGTDFGIGGSDGYMIMAQAKWSPLLMGGLPGEYMVGGYFFDGYKMARLDNPAQSKDDGYGFYAQGQQTVWADRFCPSRNIVVWAGLQFSPVKSTSSVTWQPYAGAQLNGFVPCRPSDAILLSWTSGFFTGNYNSGQSNCETVFEVNYLLQLNEFVSLQPVVQYVLSPNGDSSIDDAVVLGGQIMVSF